MSSGRKYENETSSLVDLHIVNLQSHCHPCFTHFPTVSEKKQRHSSTFFHCTCTDFTDCTAQPINQRKIHENKLLKGTSSSPKLHLIELHFLFVIKLKCVRIYCATRHVRPVRSSVCNTNTFQRI